MRKWLLLTAGILLEVTAALALRAAVERPGWYALVAVGYLGAFAALTLVLRLGVGVGVAYGIWAAAGVALTAVFATIVFGDPLTPTMGLGIILVIGGVLCVEIGAQKAHAERGDTR